jgi:hypothetical protein
MNSFDSYFHKKLVEDLEKVRAEKIEVIVAGGLTPERYHRECGYLQAITEVILTFSENVRRDINKAG